MDANLAIAACFVLAAFYALAGHFVPNSPFTPYVGIVIASFAFGRIRGVAWWKIVLPMATLVGLWTMKDKFFGGLHLKIIGIALLGLLTIWYLAYRNR